MTKTNVKALTDRQKKSLPYFASSKSYEEGCRKAGISKNTLYEWLKDPLFKARLGEMRDLFIEEAVDVLKSNITKATDVLVALLDHKESPSLVRSVANDIIGHVFKFHEMQEVERRLDVLERQISEDR